MYKSRIRRPPFPAFRLFTLRGLWGLSRFPPCRRLSCCFTTVDSKTEAPALYSASEICSASENCPNGGNPPRDGAGYRFGAEYSPSGKGQGAAGTQGECQSACEQNGAGGSRQGNGAGSPGQGSRAGAGREEEPDRAGQPDNTAQAKNGLVPAGDQAVPGESSKKCLSFSKAA